MTIGPLYGALEVRRLIRLLNIAVTDRYVGDRALYVGAAK